MGDPNSPKVPVGDITNDVWNARSQAGLRAIADRLNAIAEQLRVEERAEEWLQSGSPAHRKIDASVKPETGDEPTKPVDRHIRNQLVRLARHAYAIRRERDTIFDNPELFGEPAWDILLDLYIAQADEKSVSVSSACIGSASPPTTGLRWLGVLAEQGLIVREHDPQDQRRVFVRLSENGLAAMDAYFITTGRPA